MIAHRETAGFAELATAERDQAQAAREHAAVTTAAAQSALAEAQQEAARIVADAEDATRQADGEADGAAVAAEVHAARAALLDQADALREQAEAADDRADALAAERERLEQQAAELDARLEQLAADQAGTEAALADALEEGDVDGITASRGRIAAIGEVRDRLSPELAAARAAAAAIGGEDGPGRLAAALEAGRRHRAGLWGSLRALADDEDAPDTVRAMAALERDAVAVRASAEAAAVSDRIATLREPLSEVLARVPGERAEIERRRDLPFRLMNARLRLYNMAEVYKRRGPALTALLSAAEDRMTELAGCDPVTLADVLARGRQFHAHMASVLEEAPPLAPDDYDDSPEAVRAVLREEESAEAARYYAAEARRGPAVVIR